MTSNYENLYSTSSIPLLIKFIGMVYNYYTLQLDLLIWLPYSPTVDRIFCTQFYYIYAFTSYSVWKNGKNQNLVDYGSNNWKD